MLIVLSSDVIAHAHKCRSFSVEEINSFSLFSLLSTIESRLSETGDMLALDAQSFSLASTRSSVSKRAIQRVTAEAGGRVCGESGSLTPNSENDIDVKVFGGTWVGSRSRDRTLRWRRAGDVVSSREHFMTCRRCSKLFPRQRVRQSKRRPAKIKHPPRKPPVLRPSYGEYESKGGPREACGAEGGDVMARGSENGQTGGRGSVFKIRGCDSLLGWGIYCAIIQCKETGSNTARITIALLRLYASWSQTRHVNAYPDILSYILSKIFLYLQVHAMWLHLWTICLYW